MVGMDSYEISGDSEAVPKIIGTFFSNRTSYFRTKPRPEAEFISKYNVDILDEEVRALHTLITTNMPRSTDDRRATIEVSFNKSYDLTSKKVLAVIFPEIYMQSPEIMDYIETTLEAEPITYPEYTQNVSFFYATIYQKVDEFYRRKGYYRV